MHAWMDLVLAFILGCVLGGILSVLRFRSQLRLYKHYIESRLDSVNLQLVSQVFKSRRGGAARKQDSRRASKLRRR